MTSYRTALGRARGLGSAKHGVSHWIMQRASAVALVPLGLWALYSGLSLARAGFDEATLWLHAPVNAVLAILLAVAAFTHMKIGLQEVVEDYIHTPGSKTLLLLLNLFVCILGGVVAVFCILKVALTGAAI